MGGRTRNALAMCAVALCTASIAAAQPVPGAHKPHRIVSLNLCTDQLALLLADRADIASVSFLVRDPELSVMARQAQGIAVNHGRLEEIVQQQPDLVLAHRYASQQTVAMLRRLGYRVVEIDFPSDLAGVRAQIMQVATAIGEPARGRDAVAAMDRRFAALPAAASPRPLAAIYEPNGFAFGRASLADEILRLAGYDNLAVRLGIHGYSRLGRETLLSHPPDLLVVGEAERNRRSLAQQFLDHPALRARFPAGARLVVPGRLWLCGGPALADAAEMLARARLARFAGKMP